MKTTKSNINYGPWIFAISIVTLAAVWSAVQSNSNKYGNVPNRQQNNQSITRGNCLADDCLLVDGLEYPAGTLPADVKKSLDSALDDEYKALATYQAIIAKLGKVRPFSMIIGAEEQHIASLKAIYDKYGEQPAANPYIGKITSPATISLACQAGVQAEIANANLYQNELIPTVKDYSDITAVFTNLMNASRTKHLPAFERCQ